MSKSIQIDIDEIIKSKSSTLYKWLPKFLLNWFKRFIHQDEINEVLKNGQHLKNIEFTNYVIEYLNVSLDIVGLENLPQDSGCIVFANHPLGGLDGLALIKAVGSKREDLKFLANDILMNLEPLKDLFIPVNLFGNQGKKYLSQIKDEYSSNKAILIFPAGMVSRKIDGQIMDLEWRKSFLKQAKTHNLPLIPCCLQGENTKRFYRIANFRKKIKLKLNLEMLTLPDELYKQKGKTLKLIFGKPILPETLANIPLNNSVELLKKHLYQLKENPTLEFNSNC